MPRREPIVDLRKKPSQARSAFTVDQILQAAAQLLESRGEDGLTTKSVAEHAGVSIGTLYQYFPNRDAILAALAEREAQRISDRMRSLIDSAVLELDPARALIRAAIGSYARRRGARRQFQLVIAMAGKSGGPMLRSKITEHMAQAWNQSNPTDGPAVNNVYAYAMINAIIGVLQTAALENSPVLKEPALEDALMKIVVALAPPAEASFKKD